MYALILSDYGKTYSYFIDKRGNIIIEAWIISDFHNAHNGDITIHPTEIRPTGGKTRKLTQVELNKIFFSADWLDGNAEYFAHAAEFPMCKIGQNGMGNRNDYRSRQKQSAQQQPGSTTTVEVEHHRDPVPMQEWEQCAACYGSGQCPFVKCGGSGWYFTGDRRTICTRCHGSGKCTICAGKGGKYVIVYK